MPLTDPTRPSRADYLLFLRGPVVGIPLSALPDNSEWIDGTLQFALATVNLTLNDAAPLLYTTAVYNFGADCLINFAPDQPGGTFFVDLRKTLKLAPFAAGLVASSSDNGTGGSYEVIEAAKRMTFTDLQLAKTPWGRSYLGIAQNYGPNLWGLT